MDEDIKAYLYDILNFIIEIYSYFDGDYSIEIYKNDLRMKRATERNLEIIWEAVSRILKIDEQFQLKDARKIINLRNRIIHGYDSISDDLVLSIIADNLPDLETEVRNYLKE